MSSEWKITADEYLERYPELGSKIILRKLKKIHGFKVSEVEFYRYLRNKSKGLD